VGREASRGSEPEASGDPSTTSKEGLESARPGMVTLATPPRAVALASEVNKKW
jgi:hypothetical protein